MAHLSWMERAALLEEQLGVNRRPSVSAGAQTALVSEEPTLVGEGPTLVGEEPTLEFRTEYLTEADIGEPESGVYGPAFEVVREVAEEVRDDELFVADPQPLAADPQPLAANPQPNAPLPSEAARPSELDVPDFRRRQVGPGAIIAALGTTIAVVAATFASHPGASSTPAPANRSMSQEAKLPAPTPSPAARNTELVAPPAPAQREVTPSASPQPAAATSLETGARIVTVKVVPEGAVIFRAGKKLGAGVVEVSVERTKKQRLTALHDGYAPYNFTLDGSRETVTVRLQPALHTPTATAHESDSPFAEPRAEVNTAPVTPPTASIPESIPGAASNQDSAAPATPAD